jgi:hypothetical protein
MMPIVVLVIVTFLFMGVGRNTWNKLEMKCQFEQFGVVKFLMETPLLVVGGQTNTCGRA